MTVRWMWPTSIGHFYIAQHDGQFLVIFGRRAFGSYDTPEEGAQALACGRTYAAASGIDTASLGLPAQLSRWETCAAAQPVAISNDLHHFAERADAETIWQTAGVG